MFSSISNSISRISTKHLVVAAGFVVAMAGAIGLGLATKQYSSAAAARDCDNNAILKCGALSPSEFIKDAKSFNTINHEKQADIQNVYASQYGGLSVSEYSRFEKTARMGTVYKDGRVVVDGQTVLTGANSMGRQSFGNPNRKPLTISGKTYYYSSTQTSFADGVNSIPVMVMFDSKGAPESVIMTACGNPVWGHKVTPEYACKALNTKKITNDTYEFSTTVHQKNATVNKVVYDFGDGTTATKTNPAEVVTHKYTKGGNFNAKVTVYFNLPGKQVVAAPVIANCIKKISVPVPYYVCEMLNAVVLNDKKTQFRFTVKARYGNGATLKSADFTLDGTNTTTGVTTKDSEGNIYKDYTVAQDGKTHTVVAKVNFNIADKVTSVTCKASVEAGKTPECVEKPGSGLPPGHPDCEEKPEYCDTPGKEHLQLPKDSPECVETPPELPKAGMGSVLGIFAGTSALGAVAHRIISNRRNG